MAGKSAVVFEKNPPDAKAKGHRSPSTLGWCGDGGFVQLYWEGKFGTPQSRRQPSHWWCEVFVSHGLTEQTTNLLNAARGGDRQAADDLMSLLYGEFRRLAAHYLKSERHEHSLQPTALVHEAFLRLVNQRDVDWKGRSHFFAVGAQAMRRILVDHARRKKREKHGGNRHRIALNDQLTISKRYDEDLIAVDDALKDLSEIDPRQAKIVELRFFGGLTVAEVAEVLGVSKRTVESEWTIVRAWLRRQLSEEPNE